MTVIGPDGSPERLASVGLVIPSLDQGRFIGACLESVVVQDHPELDAIVMDGGSTDGTLDVVAGFPAIRCRSGRDGGQSAAINAGMHLVSGEWVAWLNSDDYYLPGGLRELARAATRHPDAAAIFGRALMVDVAGEEIREYPVAPWSVPTFRRTCRICQPAVLIRREAWDAAGGLDERLQCCLDYDLWFRLARQGPLVFHDRLVAASRTHAATKTSSRRLRALVEAGRVLRTHTGSASWRWSVKWMVHRWTLDRTRFVVPVTGQLSAIRSALRYQRRYGLWPLHR